MNLEVFKIGYNLVLTLVASNVIKNYKQIISDFSKAAYLKKIREGILES
jgi:hypothetical protein